MKHAAWLVRKRVDAAVASLPFLAAKQRVYDRDFFRANDRAHEPMYHALADAIREELAPRSAVDVGCGTAQILSELADHGVDVRGLEGSRHAIAESRVADRILRCNLERGIPRLGRFDVAICIEVAEHLPGSVGPDLVEALADLGERVVFTAAVPGQGGTHHINERPRAYWLDLFAERGLYPSEATERIRERLGAYDQPQWMAPNLIVLERKPAA